MSSLLGAVVASSGAALLALRMWLTHREKAFEHKPLAQMQAKLDELENKILSGVMRR